MLASGDVQATSAANRSDGSQITRTWIVRGRASGATVVFRLPGLAGVSAAASRPIAASARVSSLSPAPAAFSLVPHSGVLAASFAKPSRAFGAGEALLLADALVAVALLTLAALPARTLAHVRLAAVVEPRRTELALAGAATLVVAVVAKLLSGS
jgi:hypothetical protein